MTEARIARVEVYLVEAPLQRAFWMATEPYTSCNEVFVAITTDDGITGYGVAHGNPIDHILRILRDDLFPLVLGTDAWAVNSTWERMFTLTHEAVKDETFGQPHFGSRLRFETMAAIAALDIALWDIRAKSVGLPLYRFLGSERSVIPAYASGGYYPSEDWDDLGIEELVNEIGDYVGAGFSIVKLKAGRSVSGDIKRVAAVRQLFPDVGILVDANGGWSFKQAVDAAQKLSEYGVLWLEEPLRWHYPPEILGQLARLIAIPIAAGEQESHKWGCAQLIDRGGIRFLQFDCTRAGGITEWLQAATYASIRGVELAPHHDPQVHAHLVAGYSAGGICETFPNPARDPLWAEFYLSRPELKGGEIVLNDAPGLGVEPDREALKRWGRKVWVG